MAPVTTVAMEAIPDDPTLGELLEAAREVADLSKRKAAQHLWGNPERYREILRYEQDKIEPGPENLAKLADLYGVPLADLQRGLVVRRRGLAELNAKLDRVLALLEKEEP